MNIWNQFSVPFLTKSMKIGSRPKTQFALLFLSDGAFLFIREHLPRKETGIAQINFVCMYFYSHLHGFNLAWDRSYDGAEASQFDQL